MGGLTDLRAAGDHVAAIVSVLGDDRSEHLAAILLASPEIITTGTLRGQFGLSDFASERVRQHLAVARVVVDAPTLVAMLAACVATRRAAGPPPRATFVMTGLPGVAYPTTYSTLIATVAEAKESIILAGYAITDGAAGILSALATAADRGVEVTIIGEKLRHRAERINAHWPAGSPRPDLYTYDGDPTDIMTAFHAKVLVVDRRLTLIGSGNFTLHGLFRNIEMGVLNEGPVAADVHEAVRRLIGHQALVRISWRQSI